MRVVVSIVGQDKVGIIAAVSGILAENNINIVNVDQSIVDDLFNMIMIADMNKSRISLKELQALLKEKGESMSLDIRVQHEDIFRAMHRI